MTRGSHVKVNFASYNIWKLVGPIWRNGEMETLEMIDMDFCMASAFDSARTIHDEQLNFGNTLLQLRLGRTRVFARPLHILGIIPVSMQIKHQAELSYRRSNSGISLNFDSSTCTPTMSSTRSFISSLSMDGSVANLDGSSFHLIGGARSADQGSNQKKRCSARGEDGSAKCGLRCHCSKKRIAKCGLRCHCSKKRKNRAKRIAKVPAISNKLADEYSWRKYGQKPIKGSPNLCTICA